jgi:hypothetical protein
MNVQSRYYALTTHTALHYRSKKEKPVTTREVSEEESYKNEVKVVEQKTADTDAHEADAPVPIRKLLRAEPRKHVVQLNIRLTEPHHPAVRQLRTPVVAVNTVQKFVSAAKYKDEPPIYEDKKTQPQ